MPESVICTYVVRPEREAEFEELLKVHWPTLLGLDLVVVDDAPQHFRRVDGDGRPVFIEIFTWKDATASSRAHEIPEVAEIWKKMEPMVETWEFPHYERIDPAG